MKKPKFRPGRIEIILIVIILAILAAIIIPEFVRASREGRAMAAATQPAPTAATMIKN